MQTITRFHNCRHFTDAEFSCNGTRCCNPGDRFTRYEENAHGILTCSERTRYILWSNCGEEVVLVVSRFDSCPKYDDLLKKRLGIKKTRASQHESANAIDFIALIKRTRKQVAPWKVLRAMEAAEFQRIKTIKNVKGYVIGYHGDNKSGHRVTVGFDPMDKKLVRREDW